MASQVNPNNIDGTYPVAGQDNDSQGFRDNFTNIRNNFTYIKAEVEDLQSKALLKTNLTNSTLNNDLLGNAVVNPTFTSWRETYKNVGTLDGTNTISFSNGNFQRIVLNSAVTLNFTFPSNTSGQYASIKLWVNIPAVDPTRTLTFGTAPSLGDPDTIAGYSAGTITFSTAELNNSTDYFFEIWTTDAGSSLGIKDLTRNRDVDLSGMSITGNLSLDGLTVSTYNSTIAGNVLLGSSINTTTGSNVVIRSNIGSTSSTTGALVVSGGAGFASNLHVDGNLWVNSGNIRSSGSLGNIFNVSAATVSMGNAATNIFMGASTGNVWLAGNLNLTGTSGNPPLVFSTSGANTSVPIRGAIEYNATANVFYATPTQGTAAGRSLIPSTNYFVLGSNVALNNGTAPALTTSYSVFGGPVASGTHIGNVMLAAGTTYEFDVHSMVSMAAAPTASTIGFTFGGNATVTYYSYEVQSYPVSGTGGLNQGNTSHWYGTTTFPATSSVVLNSQAYTNFAVRARGLVKVNAQGTLLPLLQWNTAPTQIATAVQGSYVKFTPLGTAANIAIGFVTGTPFV